MIMWNEHVVKYDGLGMVNLEGLLSDFVESHFQLIFDLHLYCNFVCHMTTLQQAGLVTLETMVDTIIHMQRLINNRSLKRPCSDPVTDRAARFPSLELAPTRVLQSGAHTEKVMGVVPVSEMDKVSRSQRQEGLLPEFVSTGTDRSNLEHGPRRRSVYEGGVGDPEVWAYNQLCS